MFWFRNDLNLVNNKNTCEQHQRWWGMGNNKKMIALIRNDKMTPNNSEGVEKGHLKHQGARLAMVLFFLEQ